MKANGTDRINLKSDTKAIAVGLSLGKFWLACLPLASP
jgi:hypothetical protein